MLLLNLDSRKAIADYVAKKLVFGDEKYTSSMKTLEDSISLKLATQDLVRTFLESMDSYYFAADILWECFEEITKTMIQEFESYREEKYFKEGKD